MMKPILFIYLILFCFPGLDIMAQDVVDTEQNTEQIERVDSFYHAIEKKWNKERYDNAHKLLVRYFELSDLYKSEKGISYSCACSYMAQYFYLNGDNNEAIKWAEKEVEVRRSSGDCNELHLAAALNELSQFYAAAKNYSKASVVSKECVDIYARTLKEEHPFYAVAIGNLAQYYFLLGESSKAVECGEKTLASLKKGKGDYAISVSNLITYYAANNQLTKSIELCKVALKLTQKKFGQQSVEYATALDNVANIYSQAEINSEAIKYGTQALNLLEKVVGKENIAYGRILDKQAVYYSKTGAYKESVELSKKALDIYKKTIGDKDNDYILCLQNLSTYYARLGDLENSSICNNNLFDLRSNTNTDDVLTQASLLNKQAHSYYLLGDCKKAIQLQTEALNKYSSNYSNTTNYAKALSALSIYYSSQNISKAIQLANQAIALYDTLNDTSISYAQTKNDLSCLYYYNNEPNRSVQIIDSVITFIKNKGLTYSPHFPKILSNAALFHFVENDVDLAISLCNEALEQTQDKFGKDHPDNVVLLYNLAIFCHKKDDYKNASLYYMRALEIQKRTIRNNFLHLTGNERELYWNSQKAIIENAPIIALNSTSDSLLVAAYDAQLFCKGILLNSEIDFRNLIFSLSNDSLIESYNTLIAMQKEIMEQYKLPVQERTIDVKDFENKAVKLEKVLVNGCKEFGDFTKNMNIKTADVIAGLKQDDVAIEFVNFEMNSDSILYAALVLKHGWKSPKMIQLFSKNQLDKIKFGGNDFTYASGEDYGRNIIYNSPVMGDVIWKPLKEELDGMKNIYFSPSGILHQLAIEYLLWDKNTRMSDKFNMFRLSSTKQIAIKETETPNSLACIYGDLDYSAEISQLAAEHKKYESGKSPTFETNKTESDNLMAQISLADINQRGGASPLPGTKVEAEFIYSKLLSTNTIRPVLYTGISGTEESFKALSGSGVSLLHIATHGFYITQEQAKKHRKLLFLNEQGSDGDKSLSRTGLLFAGAQKTLSGKRLRGMEDGVLTARELVLIFVR